MIIKRQNLNSMKEKSRYMLFIRARPKITERIKLKIWKKISMQIVVTL